MVSEEEEHLLGRVVTSRAGRDRGDLYVVVGLLGPEMVLVADGQRRGVERPKKKNVKHLIVHDAAPTLAAKLGRGERPRDEDIRAALASAAPAGGAEAGGRVGPAPADEA